MQQGKQLERKRKTLSILGSTGSIGTQALEICQAHDYQVCGLAAYSSIELLAKQASLFHPRMVCIYCEDQYQPLRALINDPSIEIVTGMEGLCAVASMAEADIVLNSVVGMIGLLPTLHAAEAGKDIALANKETLVTGGKLVIDAVRKHGVRLLPVDSEHSAIFQCLQGNDPRQVNKVILTASGGPFFGRSRSELQDISVEAALKHPNWSMGAKITTDSATMMNKGLEFIEAVWLFDLTPEQIEVVVHRESVVHSAVEFRDFSVIAQLGVPDMKIPIQYALTYPDRISCPVRRLSLTDYGSLSFQKPDPDTFICLKACMEAIRMGGLMPAAVNGANEQAVALFLERRISFLQIGELVYRCMEQTQNRHNFTVDDIINTDKAAREFVLSQVDLTR